MKFKAGDVVRLKRPEDYGSLGSKDPIGVIKRFSVDIDMHVVHWSGESGVLRYYESSLMLHSEYEDFQDKIKDRLG